jgi:hypothetical protein
MVSPVPLVTDQSVSAQLWYSLCVPANRGLVHRKKTSPSTLDPPPGCGVLYNFICKSNKHIEPYQSSLAIVSIATVKCRGVIFKLIQQKFKELILKALEFNAILNRIPGQVAQKSIFYNCVRTACVPWQFYYLQPFLCKMYISKTKH